MVDRKKYMDAVEVKQLRRITEAVSIADNYRGRVKGPLAWMVVDLGLSTGLRVSEMVAIQTKDIDYKRCCLTITRVKKRHPRPETLAISTDLMKHLKGYLVNHNGEAALFVGVRGPLTKIGLQQIWNRAVKQAGLPKMSIHSSRHTLAVHLLKKTGNLRQVQKQLGHSSPAITANLYADISFEDMQSGLNQLYV